ncbi:hypothetical protein GCM10011610_42240 [Nocardia rhizosphaerihabitans]|uniref:Uncharacterized protein n=1 Tax=Nocardia rhizosphaerihabitans TaxID=1691570 RepID=A0ABQ2KMR6_9NOCA|nr:hypothetical protein GCM10011610_42240 [Nocardia rhizosphaerihabitans]
MGRGAATPGVQPSAEHQEGKVTLPKRIPGTKRLYQVEVAPPTIIRRLLEALDKGEPKRGAK